MSVARLARDLESHDAALARARSTHNVALASEVAESVVSACQVETSAKASEVRRQLHSTVEVTAPEFLVALEACRADALSSEMMVSVLAEMESSRVMIRRPRYGPLTASKAVQVIDRFEAVSAIASALAAHLAERRIVADQARNVDADAASATATAALLQLQALRTQRYSDDRADITLLDSTRAAADRRQRNDQRQLRLEESHRAHRGPEAFATSLNSLGQDATCALSCLVSSILEAPDDEGRRKLRCDNDAFRRDFEAENTISALYAFGFERVVENGHELLVLREPDPMLDIDAWSVWFDRLKKNKAILDGRIVDQNWTAAATARKKLLAREAPWWVNRKR